MTFDRFSDDLQIGDMPDGPEYLDCKQCGESFETDCFAEVYEEFCSDDCADMHAGVALETESE